MTPAQQLSKVRDVMKTWKKERLGLHDDCRSMQRIAAILDAPEGEAAGAGEAVAVPIDLPKTLDALAASLPPGWEIDYRHPLMQETMKTEYFAAPPAPKASAQALTGGKVLSMGEAFASGTAAPDTPEMKALAAFLAACFNQNMSGDNMRAAVRWTLGIPAPARMNDDKQEGA